MDAVVAANGGRLPSTVAEAARLTELEHAMKETLRLYPAALYVVRRADPGVGGELVVPSGGGEGGAEAGAGAGGVTAGRRFRVPEGAVMWVSPYVMVGSLGCTLGRQPRPVCLTAMPVCDVRCSHHVRLRRVL